MGKRALETLTESMFYVLMSFLGGAARMLPPGCCNVPKAG